MVTGDHKATGQAIGAMLGIMASGDESVDGRELDRRRSTFTTLAVCQWFNALKRRSATHSVLSMNVLRNYWFLGGLLVANLLQAAVISSRS